MAKHAVAWGLGIAMAAAVAGVGVPASAQEPQAAEPAPPAAEGAVELPKLTVETSQAKKSAKKAAQKKQAPAASAPTPQVQQTSESNEPRPETATGPVNGYAATRSATGIKTDTITGANGRYAFPSLRPTSYEIRAELAGFKTVRRTEITLQANQNLTVNITLELGELAETITVAGETATVDISSATISEVVDHARIVELPIAGREVARLQTLVAGTVLASVSEWTAPTLITLAMRLGMAGRASNLIVTNVPGPQIPLYLLGARMTETYPMVPLFTNQGLGIALFSYDGGLFWGLNADWDAVPDLHDLVEALGSEFEALRKLAAA